MTYYDIWFNLKDSSKDLEFCKSVEAYLGALKERGLIEGHTLKRRLLGLGPQQLGEFNITIQLTGLSQLERAFEAVATRGPEIEPIHKAVYSAVQGLSFALHRDFPDSVRVAEV